MTKRPTNNYEQYHAHVYFDESNVYYASALCKKADQLFTLRLGRVHRKLLGPHPSWSCQLAFDSSQFENIIVWLEEHRNDMSILVHGVTENDLSDHTQHASWLGKELTLNLAFFGG